MSKKMKKLKNIILCSVIAAFTFSIPVSAIWTGQPQEEPWITNLEFQLTSGEVGTEVTNLSSGTVERNFSTIQEYWHSKPQVTISATIDGENSAIWYWSETAYKNTSGEGVVAVLKADASQKWSEKTSIIIKVEDVNLCAQRMELEMGASTDAPRDYKIEYSIDGETYYSLNKQENNISSINEAYTIMTVFDELLTDIKRNYKTLIIKDMLKGEEYNWTPEIYEDFYLKISPASDYKVNGETGLYGSSTGEIALRTVRFEELGGVTAGTETGDNVVTAPTNVKVYKTAAKIAKLTWKKAASVDGYEIYLKKGNGAYKKVKTIQASKKAVYKLKNLSNKGTYKIRMRSYIKENGKKYYSSYTKAITLNMKKQLLPEDLSMSKKIKVKVGETKKLVVKCAPGKNKNLIKDVKYQVKNKKIVRVQSGVVKGKKVGTTTVTTKVTLKSGLSKTFTTRVKVTK